MSKRIGIGEGYALAFGFTWQALDPLDSPGDKRRELMDQGMRWEAGFRVGATDYLGVTKEDFTPIRHVHTLSGAGQMASHRELAGKTVLVVMEEVTDGDENDVAVVGLLNGNIVLDDYVATGAFRRLEEEFAERCARVDLQYTMVGKSYTLGEVEAEFRWADFRPVAAPGPLRRFGGLRAVHVRALEPRLSPALLGLVAAGILLFGGIWLYQELQERKMIEAAQVRLRQAQRLPQQYAAMVDEQLRLPVLPANTAFAQLRAALDNFAVDFAGWRLAAIDCGADGYCTATWDNQQTMGNFREFVETAPKAWGLVTLHKTGATLSHRLPFRLAMRPLPERAQWPDERTFLIRYFSEWQKYWVLGFKPELEESATVLPIDAMPVEAAVAAAYPGTVWVNRWRLKDTPWHLAAGFDRSPEKGDANLPDSVTVDRISMRFDRDQQLVFKAEGSVYVQH